MTEGGAGMTGGGEAWGIPAFAGMTEGWGGLGDSRFRGNDGGERE